MDKHREEGWGFNQHSYQGNTNRYQGDSNHGDGNSGGILYLVATPIGNLGDITQRAIDILKDVDVIAAEDTRQTNKLLQTFAISTPMVSYHEHNKYKKDEFLLQELLSGKRIALVSDAGLPGISDPGADIAQLAIYNQIPVVPIPGASAGVSSLIASGLDTERFLFYGFLSRQSAKRKRELEEIKGLPFTLIFYEAPHRIEGTMKDMLAVLGNRQISVGRELTKKFEQFIRGEIAYCLETLQQQKIQGEFTIVVSGASEEQQLAMQSSQWWIDMTIAEHVDYYIGQGRDNKEAIKLTAKDRDCPKRDVYQAYHQI